MFDAQNVKETNVGHYCKFYKVISLFLMSSGLKKVFQYILKQVIIWMLTKYII